MSKVQDLASKVSDDKFNKIVDVANIFRKKLLGDKLIKRLVGSRITLKSNEIKYIIKLITSLENRGILLKRTTRKITSQEGGFLSFVRSLMTAGLSLMKMHSYH